MVRGWDSGTLNVILNVITVLLGGGALGIILKYRLGTKKLGMDSEEAIRDHYAKEVARFQGTMQSMEGHYRRMLEDSDRLHEECRVDREKLRSELTGMHDQIRTHKEEIEGLKLQLKRYSADKVLLLDSDAKKKAPLAVKSAKRVKKIVNDLENNNGHKE